MAGKIFVRQHAVFHADTEEELENMLNAAKQLIVEGGGGIQHITETQSVIDANNDQTYILEIEYVALRTAL